MWMQCLEKQYWIDCLVRNGTCTNTILSAVLQAGLGMRVRKWSGNEVISLISPDPHWEHSCGESNLKDKLVLLVIPYHHCVCVCACVGRGVVPVIYSQCLSLAVQILGGLGTRLGGQQLHWSSWVPLTSVQWLLTVIWGGHSKPSILLLQGYSHQTLSAHVAWTHKHCICENILVSGGRHVPSAKISLQKKGACLHDGTANVSFPELYQPQPGETLGYRLA